MKSLILAMLTLACSLARADIELLRDWAEQPQEETAPAVKTAPMGDSLVDRDKNNPPVVLPVPEKKKAQKKPLKLTAKKEISQVMIPQQPVSDLPENASKTIVISAVGDVMLGSDYPQASSTEAGRMLLRSASSYIQAADIRFGNYEGTLFDGPPQADGKRPGPGRYLFRSPTEMGETLMNAGFNVMSLANNHARDFGSEGIDSTKSQMTASNIQYSSKQGEVARFFTKGLRIAVIAADFYPGSRSLVTPQKTFDEIAALRSGADIIIVSCHAGAEGGAATHVQRGPEFFMGENRGDSIGFAHDAIDAGADLIIMHGPHVPRGMEVYRDRLIAYSLGNFATGAGISISGEAGVAPLLRVQLDGNGRFVKGHVASFQQTRSQGTVYDPSLKAFELIKDLSASDFGSRAPKFSGDGFIAP